MVLFVSDNESYTLEKREDFVCSRRVCWSLTHGSSSRMCLFWKARARYLEYRLAPSEGGRPGVRGGHRELDTAERVESCCGLEEACQEGRLRDVGEGGEEA